MIRLFDKPFSQLLIVIRHFTTIFVIMCMWPFWSIKKFFSKGCSCLLDGPFDKYRSINSCDVCPKAVGKNDPIWHMPMVTFSWTFISFFFFFWKSQFWWVEITNIFFSKKMYSGGVGGVHQLRRICKILCGACGSRTTSPHTFTVKTTLYTQHFAANRMSGKTRV